MTSACECKSLHQHISLHNAAHFFMTSACVMRLISFRHQPAWCGSLHYSRYSSVCQGLIWWVRTNVSLHRKHCRPWVRTNMSLHSKHCRLWARTNVSLHSKHCRPCHSRHCAECFQTLLLLVCSLSSSTHRATYRAQHIGRVGQNRIYAPYMTVYLVISLPKIPYIHRIYMVLANPTYRAFKI